MQLEGNAHPPKDGVVLTLDSRMQQIVEQVGSQIDRGAVVVMEVGQRRADCLCQLSKL